MDFKDQSEFDAYNKKHKMRKSTKVNVGGKDTTAGAAEKGGAKGGEEGLSFIFKATPDNKEDGFKYVFQTRLTKETVNERIRSPMGMWPRNETYIDNNLQNVINRLHEYYK